MLAPFRQYRPQLADVLFQRLAPCRREYRVAFLRARGLKVGALGPHGIALFSRLLLPIERPESQNTAPIALRAGAGARAATLVFRSLCFPESTKKKLGCANGWWLRALVLRHTGVIGVAEISHRAPLSATESPIVVASVVSTAILGELTPHRPVILSSPRIIIRIEE
jgi:hypothetical protein